MSGRKFISKQVIFRFLAVAGSFIVAIGIAELILKVIPVYIGRHSDMFNFIEYDSTLGWKVKPDLNTVINFSDVENVPFRTNSLGLRDKEFPIERTPGRCRIVVLGDSFTWGLGVKAEDRFTGILEKEHPEWEVFNFGVPAYGTDQELLLWEKHARFYQPDLVILSLYSNDYDDNLFEVLYGRRKPYYEFDDKSRLVLKGVPVDKTIFWDDGIFKQVAPAYVHFYSEPVKKRLRLEYYLAKSSSLCRLIYTLVRDRDRTGYLGSQTCAKDMKELSPDMQIQTRLLSAIVIKLAEEVKNSGADFLVVFIGRAMENFAVQKQIFDAAGINYVEAITENLILRSGKDVDQIYYPYNKHFTLLGNKLLAELLNDWFNIHNFCRRHN